MIKITLPNGTIIEQSPDCTGFDIAKTISISLSKQAIAIKINGTTCSLHEKIKNDSSINIITINDDESLDIIRHSAAHIMADAVKKIYPNALIAIGPTIKNGFYYDFDISYLSPDDLEKITKEMQEIVKKNYPIIPEEISKQDAIKLFKERNEKYKLEILDGLDNNAQIKIFKQGDFIDLCKGPHVPSTGVVKFFKLLNIAGAYWRGDYRNPMLQRIYGTAWRTKEELGNHLNFLEEVTKRDHRNIGAQCNLFHFQEEATGQVFWHSKGYIIYRTIESYIRKKINENGYQEVKTPLLLNKNLWEKSGHWEKFQEHMLLTKSEKKDFALKPMNCPCHIQIFNQKTVSYKDLPIRMAEFGMCHRDEPSGSLHGLMRVRAFTQDDAHIFCTMDQMEKEIEDFCILLLQVYKDFGFNKVHVKFADRPDKRVGDDSLWDQSESILKKSVDKIGLDYTINKGEGAFYGPKLEFVLQDAIGRDWQCGTLQVDLILPQRLGAYYIGKDNNKHHPVMLHRAIIGTLERFIGILIEQHSGKMPLWLSPVQVVIATITNELDGYANKIYQELLKQEIRAETDFSSNKINYKIRKHSLEKTPLIAIIGEKEQKEGTLSYRKIGSDKTFTDTIEDFIKKVSQTILDKKDNI